MLQGGAGDVKTVAFKDGTSRGLSRRVEPVVGRQEFHCVKSVKEELNRFLYINIHSKHSKIKWAFCGVVAIFGDSWGFFVN